MPIPDCKKAVNKTSRLTGEGVAKVKPLPALGPIVLHPSRQLRVLRQGFLICVCLGLWVSLSPWISSTPASLFLLIPLSLALLVVCVRGTHSQSPGFLLVDKGEWQLSQMGSDRRQCLSEARVWPWVVILKFYPLEPEGEPRFSHSRYLVVMRDAVSEEDFRALCRWLRLCLPRQRNPAKV